MLAAATAQTWSKCNPLQSSKYAAARGTTQANASQC